jgi:hypothetical protein
VIADIGNQERLPQQTSWRLNQICCKNPVTKHSKHMKGSSLILLLSLMAVVSCRHTPKALQQEGVTTGRLFADSSRVRSACSPADFKRVGKPIAFETKKGVFFGIATGGGALIFGRPVPLYFWIDNQTNEPQTFDTCGTGWFMTHGYSIYGSKGHRVPERQEERSSRPSSVGLCPLSCTMNIEFTVPPHTCIKPHPAYNLADSYAFPPGEYTLAFVESARCGSPEDTLPEGTKRLKIKIEPRTTR